MKVTNLASGVILTLGAIIFITSCKKEDQAPPYIGNWVNISSFYSNNQLIQTKDIITFGRDNISEKIQWKNPQTDKWVDYLGIKGSMESVSEDFKITIQQAGVSAVDPQTDEPTGNIKYFGDTESGFSNVLNEFGIPVNYRIQISVADGNKEITLKKDITGDGDFLDEGEVKTYIRQ